MPAFVIQQDGGEMVRYDYPSYSAFTGRGFLSVCPDYRFPTHWHDDVEFSLVLRGPMQYNVNGRIETVETGEGFFINSRQLHSNFSENQTDCEYICILIHPLMLCLDPRFEKEFVTPLLENGQMPYFKFSGEVPWQKEICQEILAIYEERNDPAAPLLIQSHFCRIWASLYQYVDRGAQPVSERGDLTTMKAMISLVQERYRERITLEEIAAAGAVGQSKCCKLFRNYLNLTPNGYLTQYRLDKSRELLRDTDMSMMEIAEAVGFGGASYYAEVFRKWYRESPSEYRVKSRENIQYRNL